jgi:malate/lactate dehydrogenase
MKIGIIGAGNIGQTLKAMLASVDGVTSVSLGDNGAAATRTSMLGPARTSRYL